jgi:very-short-patch-repair endonuclease
MALLGIGSTAASRIDVTVVCRGRRQRPGIALHQARSLHTEERGEIEGIPVTSVARTLLDLAEVLPRRRLERVFEEADRLRLVDLPSIRRLLERSRGRHGLKPLRALLSESYRPMTGTRSGLERQFLRLRREVGLPPPLVNSQVVGYEVDMAWPDQRLVVELDSFAFHHTRAAFERDRARDAALQLEGYRVVRVTDRQLDDEPQEVVRTIRALLSAS